MIAIPREGLKPLQRALATAERDSLNDCYPA